MHSNNIKYIHSFIEEPTSLYDSLMNNITWDERMHSRKTASFGKAYNYSQITYPEQFFLPELEQCIQKISQFLDFQPNNCLINYYPDGTSTMGWHADQIDILYPDTGVAIVSLGAERTIQFRNSLDKNEKIHYVLSSGSLLYMSQDLQKEWQHRIPKSDSTEGRLSLTFRKIR